MKKVIIYYICFIISLVVFLLINNFLGVLILGILIVINYEKIVEIAKNIKDKIDKK